MYRVYEALFTKEDDGGYSVDFPDLQGCYTCGEDYEDAVKMAIDVLAFTLASAEADGIAVPAATFRHPVSKGQERVVVGVNTAGYPIEVTTAQAAKIRGVTDSRIRQMVANGDIEARKQGRDLMVSYASLKANVRNSRKVGRPRKHELTTV
jgi:predicted RNase H-like HicB family nuclease